MKLIYALLALLLPISVYAANQTIPSDREIVEIVSYHDHTVIKFSPGFQDSQDCTSNATNTIQLDTADDPNGQMYALVLAAAAASKNIGFGIGGCAGQYPRVYRVDVRF